jgi:hypothetical protein
VNDVDFLLSNKMTETAKLPDEVEIVEAIERVFVDFSNAQPIPLGAQRAMILQTSEMNVTPVRCDAVDAKAASPGARCRPARNYL